MKVNRPATRGFSLIEMIIVIAIIGVITAVVIPVISNIYEKGDSAKNMANAKHIEQMSAALASLGVAHVIPDSMGGVEATARLLREGVVVPEGPMAGERFIMGGLRDEEIGQLGSYLRVQYDMRELRLVMRDDITTIFAIPSVHQFCWHFHSTPCRIEKTIFA